MPRPLVLCALEIERRAAERVARSRADVACCGPGPAAVREWSEHANVGQSSGGEAPRTIVLFGLAGALSVTDAAPCIGRVITRNGDAWSTTGIGGGRAPVALLGVDEPVLDPACKQELAKLTGAALVDTESHAFAAWASRAGVRWAVVRGVSDGPDESLPRESAAWIDERGRTRIGRVITDILRRPSLLFAVLRLGIRSRAALRAASARLDELLDGELKRSKDPA